MGRRRHRIGFSLVPLTIALAGCGPNTPASDPVAIPSTPTAAPTPDDHLLWAAVPPKEGRVATAVAWVGREVGVRHLIGDRAKERVTEDDPSDDLIGYGDVALLEDRFVFVPRDRAGRIREQMYGSSDPSRVIAATECCAAIAATPDRRGFVYTSSAYIGDSDRTEWTVLVHDREGNEREIARLRGMVPGRDGRWEDEITLEFSPDGSHLLIAQGYGSFPNRPRDRSEPAMIVVRNDGVVVTKLPAELQLAQPRWLSEDEIVVPRSEYDLNETLIVGLDGSEPQVVDPDEPWLHGTLSPDGRLFAYDLRPTADVVGERDSAVVILDARTLEEVARLPKHFVPAFLSNDEVLVSRQIDCEASGEGCYFGYETGEVSIWNPMAGTREEAGIPRLEPIPGQSDIDILWQVSR